MASNELNRQGRTWARNVLDQSQIEKIEYALNLDMQPGIRQAPNMFRPLRNEVEPIIKIAQNLLPECRPVGAVVFNKTKETNWAVGWHQDRVIAVNKRHEVNGYDNWTRKSGIWHCEPPIQFLENMIFARVHLTDSSDENGCMQIAKGSHLRGRVQKPEISKVVEASDVETCEAKAGDVLFGKALLVHRSKPSRSNSPRLALRIDFASQTLAGPIQWAYANQTS